MVATPRLTAYHAADARVIRFTPEALQAYGHVDLERIWRAYETSGPAWTMWVGDEVVGCAGLIVMWPGVAQAWLLPSVRLAQYPRSVVTALVDNLKQAITDLHLRRVECNVDKNFKLGRRLVEWLGFDEEVVKQRAGPNDEDLVQYVIIQPRDL
jgi:RimJ/RimL family protein N-acetyltransferase